MQAQPNVLPMESLNDLLRAFLLALAIGAAIGGGAMGLAATAHALDNGEVDACEALGDPDCRVMRLVLELDRMRWAAEEGASCGADDEDHDEAG